MSEPIINRNTLYARIFVDELARSGLQAVCAAPGSRHTPLMLAFAEHPHIRVYSHLDERSAGFFALGLAIATERPVALICTSGSAAANFFPAIVEAHESGVPLLVLTADRPHELRHSGANQTIDQIKIFGDYARWFVDAPLPEAQPDALTLRHLRTLAGRAFAEANGIRKGVVHINFPFRKPLEPTPVPEDMQAPPPDALARVDDAPYVRFAALPCPQPDASALAWLGELVTQYPRGLIVCGPRCPGPEFRVALMAFARHTGYPVVADALSGLRQGHADVIGAYDTFLNLVDDLPQPEIVLRFGDVPTSQALNDALKRMNPAQMVQIRSDGLWRDDSHRLSAFVQADETAVLMALLEMPGHDGAAMKRWYEVEQVTREALRDALAEAPFFDAQVVAEVLAQIPAGGTLFAGNSLPVRHVDQFNLPDDRDFFVYASRGASGIDGNISTALGVGAGRPDGPLVAVMGDITFYHDMNGLLAVQRCGVPVTLVLLNNDGGGIFHRLPVNRFEPAFTDYFITAHGLDFRHAAALYGIEYVKADSLESFRDAFAASVGSGQSRIIAVRTDSHEDLQQRRAIIEVVRQRLREYVFATD